MISKFTFLRARTRQHTTAANEGVTKAIIDRKQSVLLRIQVSANSRVKPLRYAKPILRIKTPTFLQSSWNIKKRKSHHVLKNNLSDLRVRCENLSLMREIDVFSPQARNSRIMRELASIRLRIMKA